MQAFLAVKEARALMESVTPLKRDCGRYCGAACCEPDEDGQGGMLLFPGEEGLYETLPEGFTLMQDDAVFPDALLLSCEGYCERAMRPLSCMLFPLLPGRNGPVMDQRGWAVCPLMQSGIKGLQKEFTDAVQKAGEILYACPETAAFLDALHAYNESLKAF